MDRLIESLRRHSDAVAAIALFLLVVFFFLPGLNFDAVPLDGSLYVGREYLLYPTWKNFLYHLKNPVLGLYSPLVMHSLMLDYAVWGKEALLCGGRLHNILLHALNAVMFYCLLRQLKLVRLDPQNPFTLSIPAAIFGAFCFALHPQRVESVIWVVERKDVLALFFGLASALLFIRSYRRDRLPLAGAALFLLSFGAKPLLITLPAALLAGIWVGTEKFDRRRALKMISPYLAAAALYFFSNASGITGFAGGAAAGIFSAGRVRIVLLNYANYFFRTLMPLGIRPLYPVFRFDTVNTVLCVSFWLTAAGVMVGAVCPWRRRKLCADFLAPLLLAFAAAVLPMAGLRSIGNAEFADRYSYYPSLFLWIAAAAGYEYFSRKRFLCKFLFAIYGLFIALLGILYLYTWQTEESFINAALGDGSEIHPAAMRMAAWSSFRAGEFDLAMTFAKNAERGLEGDAKVEAELFTVAMDGMISLIRKDPSGLDKLDRAITTPQWGRLRTGSAGFSEQVLIAAASAHLDRGTEKDRLFAAEIYMVLGHLSCGSDMAKEFNYRAISAMLREDYPLAESLTLKALEHSPGDANLLFNLKCIRARAEEKKPGTGTPAPAAPPAANSEEKTGGR